MSNVVPLGRMKDNLTVEDAFALAQRNTDWSEVVILGRCAETGDFHCYGTDLTEERGLWYAKRLERMVMPE